MQRKPSFLSALLAAVFLLAVPSVDAQTVTGRVVQQGTGQPMVGVQVYITGSGIGALTSQNGRYLLLNVPVGTHAITAERIGFRSLTQEVTVTADATVVQDFTIAEEALGLDEIIVTGTPGGTQRRAIGNSVLSVQAADVSASVATQSIQDLMGNRTAGLQFSRVEGSLGTGSAIAIRGNQSFSLASNPLIYVDGIRVNNASDAGPRTNQAEVNVLNDFNPQDIESIEIIKGPAAATLYGTEASAGVIQIITKRGATGAPRFDASIRGGINYMRDPARRMGTRYGCKDTFRPPCREGEGLISYNPYEEANWLIENGEFPWVSKELYQNGPSQSYNLSVRGGTDVVSYFLSGNYDDDVGMIWYNTHKAFRLRANVGVVFNELFSLDVSTGYVDGDTRFMQHVPGQGGEWTDMQWGNGYCQPRINPGAAGCEFTKGFQEHLPSDAEKIRTTREFNRFTGSATLNFTKAWLSSRIVAGLDKGWDENQNMYPLGAGADDSYWQVYREAKYGRVNLYRPITTYMSLDWGATARLALTDAIGTATSVGAQYNVKEENRHGTEAIGLASPLSTTVNQAQPSRSNLIYDFVENKSVGFYVQEELSFNDRIFVTGAVRFDDNSAFGSDLSPEMYPKISATWTLSDESFWNVEQINSLRIRGAFGAAGRQPDAFAGQNQYGVIQGPSGTSALDPVSPGNTSVGPERSTELEVGFDIALLNDRISGDFSWYSRQTKDALLEVPLPPSVGFAGELQRNIGRIDAWGWEASLHTRIYESPAFSFGLDVTGSYTMNEIMELGDFPGTNEIKIGWSYPALTPQRSGHWVVSAEFVPEAQGNYVNSYGDWVRAFCDSGRPLGPTPQHGRMRGGEPVLCSEFDASKPVAWGPSFFTTRFSVTPTITLFNGTLQMHALADGGYGKFAPEGDALWAHRYDNSKVSRTQDDPTFVAWDALGSWDGSSHYDADFWKLREVGIRYLVPESLSSRIGAENASLILSAREVGIIWRRQATTLAGIQLADPEMGYSNNLTGSVQKTTPPLSRMTVEARVSF